MSSKKIFGFGVKSNNVEELLKVEDLFKREKYSLLETVSILKYKANKDVNVNHIEVMNMINRLRVLVDKFSKTTKQTSKDVCMQLSFELGTFCNEFDHLCTKLGLNNPLKDFTLNEVYIELTILKEVDKEYYTNVEEVEYTNVTFKEEDYDFKMYDTLFYLDNHCIIGVTAESIELVLQDVDKNLAKLKEFVLNRKGSTSNEDLAFYIGTLIEALATVAYDYDLPNELNISFNTGFVKVFSILDLAFKEMDRFKTMVQFEVPTTTASELENDINIDVVEIAK